MLDCRPAKEPPAFTRLRLSCFLSPSVREASPKSCEPGAVRPQTKSNRHPQHQRAKHIENAAQPFACDAYLLECHRTRKDPTPEHARPAQQRSADRYPHSPPPRARRARENFGHQSQNKIKMAQKSPAEQKQREICSCKPANPTHWLRIKTKARPRTQNTDWLNSSVMEGSAAIRST